MRRNGKANGKVRHSAVEEQAPPKATGAQPVWDMVVADARAMRLQQRGPLSRLIGDVVDDMQQRDRIGRQRYGTPLTVDNGRNHLVDAYQEILDASVYIRAAIAQGHPKSDELVSLYGMVLGHAVSLKGVLG